MNSPSAYYLLLLYLTVVGKPLVPIIQDMWAHEFNEIEHLTTVHSHSGSHHLQKEIAGKEAGENNKNSNTLKPADEVPVHLIAQANKIDCRLHLNGSDYSLPKHLRLPLICLSYPSPPPKFFCRRFLIKA